MPKSRTRKPQGGRPPQRPRPDLDAEMGAAPYDEDHALLVSTELDGTRHAVVLPRSISRLSSEQLAIVKSLQRNALRQQILRQEADGLVDEARDYGVTWAAIGWSLGTTGEAARQRWGDFDTAQEPR